MPAPESACIVGTEIIADGGMIVFQVGKMNYVLDGGGFTPPSLDYVQITVHEG